MENPIEMDDLGGKPSIFGNIHICENHSRTAEKKQLWCWISEFFLGAQWLEN